MVYDDPEKSCQDCVELIKQQDPEKKMKHIIRAIKEAELRGDRAELVRLIEEQQDLSKRPAGGSTGCRTTLGSRFLPIVICKRR